MPEFTWSTESSQVAPCVHDELMRMLELEVWVGGGAGERGEIRCTYLSQ